jgi:tetratricopeptide (TPR) repeat protein
MKRAIGLIVFFIIGCSKGTLAGLDYNTGIAEAYSHIIRLEFDAGAASLEQVKRQDPSNHLVLLYENYIDFLKAFISEEPELFGQFKKNFYARYKVLEKESPSPWRLFALAEMKMQDSFLKIKFREFISAAFGIRTAYKLLVRNDTDFPGFLLNKKCLGLIHVAIGSVPGEYRWLVDMAGMKGTVPQGIAELNQSLAVVQGIYAPYREEIYFYMATIQSSLSFPVTEQRNTASRIRPFATRSILMKYVYVNLCIRSGNSSQALEVVFSDSTQKHFPFYFLNYKIGMLLLYKLDFSSENYFRLFLAKYQGQNFVKSAYQKLAWIAFLKGDTAAYHSNLQQAMAKGTSFVDDDKQAGVEALSRELPNKILLQSRLLYDGGYYEPAFAEFKNTSIKNFPRYRDQLETTYRLARIYQALGQPEKAIGMYRQTLRNGETASWYYAANSALLLGNYYEAAGVRDSAIFYYRKCLQMKNHDYQNSIDQKARAGLENLGEE